MTFVGFTTPYGPMMPFGGIALCCGAWRRRPPLAVGAVYTCVVAVVCLSPSSSSLYALSMARVLSSLLVQRAVGVENL